MQFFSGFSLVDEEYLFDEYLNKSAYTVCGFSYGAIKALKYTNEQLELGNRVDRLQLFSPAFFQTKSTKFKKLQLMGYKKDKINYMKSFLSLCFEPYEKKVIQNYETKYSELEELLNYEWELEDFKYLIDKGLHVEVYLGGEDKIIDADAAKEFFLEVSTVTYIKKANHFLQIN